MKKNIFLIFLSLIIFPITIKAETTEYTLFESNIKVNEDRVIEVSEKYRIYFIENTNKINRKIDLKLIQIDPNSKKTYINAIISNIDSLNLSKLETKDNIMNITMNVDGIQDEVSDYKLNYKYNLGKDNNFSHDEFFYNIVSGLDSSISNLTFKIIFPKNIPENSVYFSIDGIYNLTDDDVSYKINENEISGTLNKLLEANQSFSVYVKLPNNYFVGATDNFNYANFLILIFPVITLLVILYFYYIYGKNNKMIINRSKEIPYNFDPAEIGYLYKGKCNEMDLVSDLIYLASKGYIRIVENDDGYKLGKENSFKLIKTKNYEKNNAVQKILLDNLFKEKNIIELKDIEYKFATTFKEAKSMLDNNDNEKKLFFQNINSKKIISMILIALSVFMISFNPVHLFMNNYWLIFIVSAIFILGLYILFLSNSKLILKIIISIILFGICMYISILPIIPEKRLLIIYLIGIILIFISCLIYKKIPYRTIYGNDTLGKTYGLKYYLENISKQDLENENNDNEFFYFDMIPYAYVLDSLEIWIKKGEGIINNPPDWFMPSSEFNLFEFEQFIKNLLYNTALVMMKQTYSEFGNVQYENTKLKTNLND